LMVFCFNQCTKIENKYNIPTEGASTNEIREVEV